LGDCERASLGQLGIGRLDPLESTQTQSHHRDLGWKVHQKASLTFRNFRPFAEFSKLLDRADRTASWLAPRTLRRTGLQTETTTTSEAKFSTLISLVLPNLEKKQAIF
jgi:hypothetical protein